ncbi:hemolysin family protein [[Clostridium] polysaccharolyticum]|nr:hemolysin family protein [[Clostridium] polysaccharolyticum]
MGIILLLVIWNGVVSAAHAAFTSINENQIRKRLEENENNARAFQILNMLEEPGRYINLFEVLMNSTSIVIGMLFTSSFYVRVFKMLRSADGFLEANLLAARILAVLIAIFFICIVIFFGNVLPRRMAKVHAERSVYYLYGVLYRSYGVLKPVLWLMDCLARFSFWILRIRIPAEEENVTEDEIISIVNEGYEQGVLEDSEAEMISNIIEFDEKEVMDVMTHRKKIRAIDGSLTVAEAMEYVLQQPFSRFPVYEETIDNIVGILHIKDMMKYYISGKDTKVPVKEICGEPYLVPDTQQIDVLLNDMRARKMHMAIAIDEYGQTAGLVAMEDILEEIVGAISDEYDIEEKMITKQSEGRFLMKGMTSLEEVEEVLDIDMEQEDFDTLNGFLISMLGHIPSDGEKAVFHYMGYKFHIVDVVDKVIRYVRVVKE